MTIHKLMAALTLALTLVPRVTLAQETPPPLHITGHADLARLVDLAASRNRVIITYDAAQLKLAVVVRSEGDLDDFDLWELANQLLIAQGFATIRTPTSDDRTFAVTKLADATTGARLEPAKPVGEPLFDPAFPAPGYATVVLRPRHAPAKDLIEAVKPLLSKSNASASELGKEGLILLSDTVPKLTQIAEVLATLDKPEVDVVIEEYMPRNSSAEMLAASVAAISLKADAVRGRKLAGDIVNSGTSLTIVAPRTTIEQWRTLLSQMDQRPAAETRTYTPLVFAVRDVAKLIEQQVEPNDSDDRWRLVVDDLTGTLIITGTATQHDAVDAILERLNSVEHQAMPVRSFAIRNRPVSDVLATLSNLIEAGVLDAQMGEVPAETSPLLPEQSRGTPENPVAASVSPGRDIASGGRTSAPGAKISSGNRGGRASRARDSSSRDTGDSRWAPPRLTLTADEGTNTLIAVGEPRLLNQLETLLATIDVRQPQVMLEVMLVSMNDSDAKSLGVELERISTSGGITHRVSSLFGLSTPTLVNGQPSRSVGDAAGFTGAVLDPGEFSVVVRAIETLNRGRQKSVPKVLVNNNEQVQLSSTLQQPVTTQRSTDQTTTTSFAGFEDAGTQISIRPQIAEGDHLVLQYSLSLSSFIGSATGGVPPARQQNEVTSIATIPDGHTVVVGGLELVTDGDSESRIPLLGRIPLVGNLFKNQGKNTSTTRFYVFIKATVLRDQNFEDLKYLSAVDAKANNVDDGWPVVEPRIIK